MAVKKEKAPTLYDMTEDLKAMMDDIDLWAEDHEGDVSEYPLDRLEKLEGDVKSKVLKCAQMYKEWKAQGVAIKAEEKALKARREAHENRGDRLKAYMESCLPPNAKFEDARSSVSWKNNPPSVDVLAPIESIPEKFLKRPPPEVKLAELKACMQEFEVPVLNDLGEPVFDTENQPMVRTELQVRWPKPVLNIEGDDVPFAAVADPSIPDYFILARMVQGRSLQIK